MGAHVGVGLGVRVGVTVEVGVTVGVAVAVGVSVAVGVDVGVDVAVDVKVGSGVGAGVGVGLAQAQVRPSAHSKTRMSAEDGVGFMVPPMVASRAPAFAWSGVAGGSMHNDQPRQRQHDLHIVQRRRSVLSTKVRPAANGVQGTGCQAYAPTF